MKRRMGCRGGSDKIRIRMLVLMFAAIGCLCGCGENKEIAVHSSPVVGIDLGSSAASGVIYECTEEEVVIVTAGHVLAGKASGERADSVEVIFGETRVTASEMYISGNSETAFVTIHLSGLQEDMLENCQAAVKDRKCFDQLGEKDPVVMKGFSADGELLEISGTLIYSWIYAEDFGQYIMLVDGQSFPGMSGGGVFDETGNLVGILCGVNDTGESAAVPLSIIVAEYMQAFPDAYTDVE